MNINDIIIEEQLNVIGPETENKTLSNLFKQKLLTIEALWRVQIEQYPDSVFLTPEKVFAWCDEPKTETGKLRRYIQVSMAIQYPVYVFYRIEGTRYMGMRFGLHGSEYMSLYSD